MAGTIYGGTTKNGVIVQDMIDDSRDLIYRNNKLPGLFARLVQSLLREDDTEFITAGPAIAIFSDEEPFNPIWGIRLEGSFADYTDGWSTNKRFADKLCSAWKDFKKGNEKMRSFEEVGRINFSEDANEAYRAYASLYLDFCDDNMSHFRWRDIDIAPMKELEEFGEELTDESVKRAYLKDALGIAKDVLSGGCYKTLDEFYNEYPLLREYNEELEHLFYEKEGGNAD